MSGLQPVVPEIVMTALTLAIFTAGLFIRGKSIIAGLCMASAVVVACLVPQFSGSAFGGMFVADRLSATFKLIFLANLFLGALISMHYRVIEEERGTEYFTLLMLATTGMMLMASAGDLLILYLSLELMALSTYVLTGFLSHETRSNEASLKYFLLGTFASAVLLYGIAITYGFAGTTNLSGVAAHIAEHGLAHNPALTVALIAIASAFAFKIAAAPFHMWAPDAYEGAPTTVTAFMSIGPKAAGFAAFGRVLFEAFGQARPDWSVILAVVAVLSMAVGNVLALSQTNLKRMLAYSSIAHAGYMLLGVIAGTQEGLDAVAVYLIIYALMNVGAFGVVILLDNGEDLRAYQGLSKSNPLVASAMLVFMFSLTGIPPTAGFIGKLQVFMAAVHAGYTSLVIIAVIFSVISAYYYLRIVMYMYMRDVTERIGLTPSPSLNLALFMTVALICLIGVLPSIVIGGILPSF